MVAKTLLGPKRIRPELSGARPDLKGARLSSGTRVINQQTPLVEPTGSLTAEIFMDAGVTHANDLSMQRVAAKGTQCTSGASAANFVSKRPPGPLRGEQFKLGGPPTLTGLDETGLPQSAEPVAEAKYIFAYVGKAGRPEIMSMDGNDGIKMDGIDCELDYSKEESRARISNADATRLKKGAMGVAKTMKLVPGDLNNSLAKLPDEVVVPLVQSLNSADDPKGELQITDGPTETICFSGLVLSKHGKVARVLLTNPKSSMTWCPAHFPVLNCAPHGILPPEGFVRLSSAKYRDWQILAYETAIGKDLLRKERQLYDEWMERQPPAVERRTYSPPTKIARRPEGNERSRRGENSANAVSGTREMTAALRRVLEASDGLDGPVVSLTRDEDGSSRVLASTVDSAESAENNLVAPRVEKRGNPPDRGKQTGEINVSDDMLDDDPDENLHLRYLLAAELDNDERGEGEPGRHNDVDERVPNSLAPEDYAHELAFLPDLTDVIPTQLDYSAGNVVCSAHSAEQTTRLIRVLQSQEQIMISSGNALPPPAYGVHLKKLYELLKALLKAGLIAFSNSPWASPIVIVLKKNGVDIRLCIDYKLVNAITLMKDYAMPLIDDLLTELDAYLWFCSLDTAIGFWPSDPMKDFIDSPAADMFNTGEPDPSSWVPVFERRSFVDDICFGGRTFDECLETLDRLLKRFAECRISVSFPKSIFVQPKVDFLSHKVSPEGIQADPKTMAAIAESPFPTTKKGMQAFLGALNYYGRFIENLAVYGAVLYQIKEDDFAPGGDLTAAKAAFAELKTKVIEAPILRHFDLAKDVQIMLFANEWTLSSTMMQMHDNKLHPVWFCGRSLKHLAPPSKNSATDRMDPELLYTRVPADYDGCVVSFDGSAKSEKNGGYGSCSWILWRLPSWDIEIAASAHLPSTTVNIAEYTGMNNGVVAALQRGVSDLIIVGDARFAIQQSMGVIACKKDALQVELARHKELTKKLNSVRYLHMSYTCENSADIRKNSATIGNQSTENSAERTEEPKVTATTRSQARRVRFEDEGASDEQPVRAFENPSKTPTRRESVRYEAEFGGAQSQVSNDTAELLPELSKARTPDASDIDLLVVQPERRQRISKAQDEELRWADLKAYLKGEFTQLSHRRVHNAGKVEDEFVLSEDGLLYRQNKVRRPEELGELGLTLRLVVPTTMIDEVLQNCHNSIEGGHQVIVRTYHRHQQE
ncbi:unnamed protein product [Phytophthora fragariaefolia]|uniref:Unnamed protein product n=1 Tax=Phytophthora fragariaefolia TaxID=1490495 RepID=A0A9W6YNT7_9STRA|nr:unnamed protein product [Phytophthora fragariaefolia]